VITVGAHAARVTSVNNDFTSANRAA
jgi:hypothetical protein